MTALFPTLLDEFKAKLAGSFVWRDALFPETPKKIRVAVGMRRTGKTTFLFQEIKNLLSQGISLERILYLNFEDDRLLPMGQQQMAALIDAFYAHEPENHGRLCYLFLDEVQNVENWSLVVRRLFDTKNVRIYLSGSSAKLLSKEIASSLRGRSLSTEIWPYSFSEYLRSGEMEMPPLPWAQRDKDRMGKQLRIYLSNGGFPEVAGLKADDRMRILQDYVNVVVFRDIVERHQITNISLIKYLIKTLVTNTSGVFSVNKCFNDLKSQGFKVGKNTLYDYLGHVEDAYLLFLVPLYSSSLRKSHSNPRKVYAVDTGLVKAHLLTDKPDWGKLFENLIYLDLRRKCLEVSYYLTRERYEVDFVVKNPRGKIMLYQSCFEASNKITWERENRALKGAEKELGIKGQIITPENYFEFVNSEIFNQ